MQKLELVAAGGISPVRTDPDLVFRVTLFSRAHELDLFTRLYFRDYSFLVL